ncbi:polysaccharide deacetylase [Permianibacter aggregans]|uniref:Polysaccharide deacetylase n=2 Tax=Permianibacter aggregans TaxID=1510150 RepID=A0A4V3D7T3_9GAMM|nr:polysaccharide deacetylase [Permianibacter aggregans]
MARLENVFHPARKTGMSGKQVFWQLTRWLGINALARALTRNEARILCYHGFSYRDEHRFSAPLFMRIETFRRRLQLLSEQGFSIISLEELTQRLEQQRSLNNCLVITVDDGWTGFAEKAWPELQARKLPCTLYLTTWCVEHQLPVLNVVRRYLRWHGVSLPDSTGDDTADWTALQQAATKAGLSLHNEQTNEKLFHLITAGTTKRLHDQGCDIQLHTHRHRVPEQDALLQKELNDNRDFLHGIIGDKVLNHFCYPSGEYRREQFAALREAGIRSATTTELGLVCAGDEPLALKRLLDADDISEAEFLAELSGLKTLLRRLKQRLRGQAS